MANNNKQVRVTIKDLLGFQGGMAVFLQANGKLFVIQVEMMTGFALTLSYVEKKHDRPLTHDLISSILLGFNVQILHSVITDMDDDTYYARLTLEQTGEAGRKLVEIDARPSDCLILCSLHKKPVYILKSLLDRLADVQEVYEELKRKQREQHDDE